MALNIKNPAAEKLAGDVSQLAGESKTQAIRQALEERKSRLEMRQAGQSRRARLERFLVFEAWPGIPQELLGKAFSKNEEDAILGYGEAGV